MTEIDADAIFACADLVGRTGATELKIGYLSDTPPCGWYAHAQFRGARISVEDQPGPVEAADALSRRLLHGGRCTHCGAVVTLSDGEDGPSCRWHRMGQLWVRGCEGGERLMGGRAAGFLTTLELHDLDQACQPIRRAFGRPPYLVGSAQDGSGPYRDVDVRLMLDEAEFAAACPTLARWELLCMAVSAYLRERTGLPVDFQVQRTDIANGKFGRDGGPGTTRNPLGLGIGRSYAGGGDATPDWEASD